MAMVADFLVAKLRDTLHGMAAEELAKQIGLVEDIEMLQGTLDELQPYLQDAEKKSVEDASANTWLCRIKDVIYDIEDVLDEYPLEADEGISDNNSSTSPTKPRSSEVCCNSSIFSCLKKGAPKNRISAQIVDLHNKLKKIMNQKSRLAVVTGCCSNSGEAANKQLAADMVRSIVVKPDVVGSRIRLDTRNLVGSLIAGDSYNDPLVYGIVGTGGIGKSTLARLVFEDSSIKNQFNLKSWVGISQDRSEIDTLRLVVESFSKKDERSSSMELLEEKFKDMANGKRFFMVLDDVQEVDGVWDRLFKRLLKSTAPRCSCKVLVTTRNKEIAVKMKAVYFLQMEPLPLEDGWLLLRKAVVATGSEQQEAEHDDEWGLKDLGFEFVKRCNGLPLAINVIGGILSAESRTREAWTSVLKDSIWEVKGLPADIHAALYMGFQYLPLHVKQCLLYCSLNPKDVLLNKTFSFEQWIQEGFIKDENNLSPYAIEERYLRLLVRRNLLTFSPKYFDENYFVMHDVFCSLCRFLTQNESLVANAEELLSIKASATKMKLRRLSFLGGGEKTTEILPKFLQKFSSLRSLLVFDQSITRIDDELFSHLRRLRVLDLLRIRITELPSSVGALTQLRYLNLTGTFITELPETIGNLKNLRVLIVALCLHLTNLPPGIMSLHRLCSLSTFDSALNRLPVGLRRLHELRVLEFSLPLGDDAGESSAIEDLGALTQLRELTLQNLERVSDVSKVTGIALKEKQLEGLHLGCSASALETGEHASRLEEVFEELCPPSQLKVLVIVNYYGSKLPTWLSPEPSNNVLYEKLKFIKLENCSKFKRVPAFGLLPSLETLHIEGASGVESIGLEFYAGIINSDGSEKGGVESTHETTDEAALSTRLASLSPFFSKLKLFCLKNMAFLEDWKSPGGGLPTMQSLEVLLIGFCPKLKTIPEDLLCHSKALKKLIIEKSGKVQIEMDHNVPDLEILINH